MGANVAHVTSKPLLFSLGVLSHREKEHGALHSHGVERAGVAVDVVPVFRHQIALVLGMYICNDIEGI